MVELLLRRYTKELDWLYLEKKAENQKITPYRSFWELRKEF
jgi:hypothetical protein